MTPDRPDHTPDEAVNGVLSDTGSLDTTGLGILGGATAQVSVELPTESEDDLADDDVIDDEVPFVVHIPADAELPAAAVTVHPDEPAVETAEAEIIETEPELEDWTAETGGFDHPQAVEDIADADEVFEVTSALDETAVGEAEAAAASPLADGSAPDDDDVNDADFKGVAAFAADEYDAVTFEDAEFEDAEFAAGLADAAAATAEEPMIADTPSDDAPEESGARAPQSAASAPPAAPAAPTASTGPTPATRREAHHTGALPVVERAVERSQPRAGVALTSKRLGEFEPDRETADLLTADRLLDPHQVIRSEPEGMWQHFLYSISGRRINLGDGKRARARKELDRRISAPLTGGARFVPVLSRKGGVGKTTVTTLLGMALADARDDRVIAVDANPDRGTLAERISRESGKTVRDLVRVRGDVVGFNDLSNIVARDETRLDVVASDTDPRVSEAFNDQDYRDVASLAAHYYSVVLTDTGTGIVHSVMGATLDLADQIVIVAGLSVDEARLASETLTWLETNGYSDKVRGAVVVLNNARPGQPLVQLDELESHFRTRVRSVVRMPYDPHIATGSAIVFRDLQPATRLAARELAAAVVEGLRSYASAA
ncbi:MinD/ParA family ATP-binding protein [Microbacterium sp. I2]|uniref:MinD/ParA family ATP-binding protein n=1 Tax=Microbacterium sp. I2 TaxID=3391826 RepID=UPI003ED9FFFF